ncbi:hypothetical protein, partial [Escherichia coli]|uniref:hypothetical protein n=1 Tax=Escherichia coli TaxID=562 RepID=UPI001E41F1D2
MDYPNLPKQTFADLIALRQAVVALINLLPDNEKEFVKTILNRTAADFSSFPLTDDLADLPELIAVNRPGFPGEYFICELRLPDHYFRWKHNKLFLLLPEEYGP